MGRIRFSYAGLERSLGLPSDWRIVDIKDNPRCGELVVFVEGATVEDAEYQGTYTSKIIDGEDGRWIQSKWEIAPVYYGTMDDLRRTLNEVEQLSRCDN